MNGGINISLVNWESRLTGRNGTLVLKHIMHITIQVTMRLCYRLEFLQFRVSGMKNWMMLLFMDMQAPQRSAMK